jgi:hypothetical protein
MMRRLIEGQIGAKKTAAAENTSSDENTEPASDSSTNDAGSTGASNAAPANSSANAAMSIDGKNNGTTPNSLWSKWTMNGMTKGTSQKIAGVSDK